jgi:hypothetical protein
MNCGGISSVKCTHRRCPNCCVVFKIKNYNSPNMDCGIKAHSLNEKMKNRYKGR